MIRDFFDNNHSFCYLKSYYSLSDSAERYGVSRMEIKHSNFLAWILKPENNGNLGTSTIRNLLKLIQSKATTSTIFNKLDLDNVNISDIEIKREKVYNIDLFISMKINNDHYVFIIENKIYAIIHDDQLNRYKNDIQKDSKFANYNIVCAFLYTDYQDEEFLNGQLSEVKKARYTPITYQDIYEGILLPILEFSTNNEFKFIIMEYIHCLASYNSDAGNEIMIITKQDRKCLTNLFKEELMLKFIDEIKTSKKSNEYTDYYKENHSLILMCFNKYRRILLEDATLNENMIIKLDSIIKNKRYIMNNTLYKGLASLLVDMFKYLSEKKNYTYERLNEIFNQLYPNPLIISEEMLSWVRYPYWYTNSLLIDNKTYYVLSAWRYDEYEGLKERINLLNMGITLE